MRITCEGCLSYKGAYYRVVHHYLSYDIKIFEEYLTWALRSTSPAPIFRCAFERGLFRNRASNALNRTYSYTKKYTMRRLQASSGKASRYGLLAAVSFLQGPDARLARGGEPPEEPAPLPSPAALVAAVFPGGEGPLESLYKRIWRPLLQFTFQHEGKRCGSGGGPGRHCEG